jgi:hypothetical protein
MGPSPRRGEGSVFVVCVSVAKETCLPTRLFCFRYSGFQASCHNNIVQYILTLGTSNNFRKHFPNRWNWIWIREYCILCTKFIALLVKTWTWWNDFVSWGLVSTVFRQTLVIPSVLYPLYQFHSVDLHSLPFKLYCRDGAAKRRPMRVTTAGRTNIKFLWIKYEKTNFFRHWL